MKDRQAKPQRALGGRRNAIRAEQMRAVGLTEPAIARTLGVRLAAVRSWFDLQDELVRMDDADGAE
jgi:hypothetical protein